jgi:hypothetical protein
VIYIGNFSDGGIALFIKVLGEEKGGVLNEEPEANQQKQY